MIAVGLGEHPAPGNYIAYTLLHEALHLVAYTDDIKYIYTESKNTHNAEGIKKDFEKAIRDKTLNMEQVDKFSTHLGRENARIKQLSVLPDSDDAFYRLLEKDSRLRANLMMDNADNVAAYMIDIAGGRAFNASESRLYSDKTQSTSSLSRQPRVVNLPTDTGGFKQDFLSLQVAKVLGN